MSAMNWRIAVEMRTSGSSSVARAMTARSRSWSRSSSADVSLAARLSRCITRTRSSSALQAADVDAQPEAVEQLRAQLALLRVHGAHQHQPRRVRQRHALALDGVDAHRGGVEEHVDEVVVEEVDLVDVEEVAVGGGEQARARNGARRA